MIIKIMIKGIIIVGESGELVMKYLILKLVRYLYSQLHL